MSITAFHYDSDLIGGSLMVREARIIADLLLTDSDDATFRRAIFDENQLQKPRPASAKRISRTLRKRLARLPSPFWRALRDGDDELAAQIAFCAAMARNLLLVEFIETVVADALLTRAEALRPYQWDEFLEDRSQRDPAIAGWRDSSRKKMRQVTFRMLTEVGSLERGRNHRLRPIRVRPELSDLLQTHRLHRINACLNVLQA